MPSKRNLLHVGGNVNHCSNYGEQHGFLKKLKIELHNAAVPFRSILPKKTKTLSQKDTRTPIFTAAFHIQDIEATYISNIDRCSVYTHTHTHNGILIHHERE